MKKRFSGEQKVCIVAESRAHRMPATTKKHGTRSTDVRVSTHIGQTGSEPGGRAQASLTGERPVEEDRGGSEPVFGYCIAKKALAKILSVPARREWVRHAYRRGLSLERGCWLLSVARSVLDYQPAHNAKLLAWLRRISAQYPDWGYRLTTVISVSAGGR